MADSSFFQSYKGTVQPGDLFTIHRRGRSVAMVAASDDLEIVINDGSRSRFFAGASLSFDVEFEKIQIYNPNGTAATFELWTAMGRVDDNRLTASGDLNVIDPNTGDSFAEVLAMMQNASDKRSDVIEVIGDNYYSAAPTIATQQIIDPVNNVAGVIVRRSVIRTAATTIVSLFSGTSAPSGFADTSVEIIQSAYAGAENSEAPIYLPAGYGLYVAASDNGGHIGVGWDYLP